MASIVPIHPKDFRKKHKGMSIQKMHLLTKIPYETLRHYLADERSDRYVEPPLHTCNHFGYIDLALNSEKVRSA